MQQWFKFGPYLSGFLLPGFVSFQVRYDCRAGDKMLFSKLIHQNFRLLLTCSINYFIKFLQNRSDLFNIGNLKPSQQFKPCVIIRSKFDLPAYFFNQGCIS